MNPSNLRTQASIISVVADLGRHPADQGSTLNFITPSAADNAFRIVSASRVLTKIKWKRESIAFSVHMEVTS
jgi:hypothetical protein